MGLPFTTQSLVVYYNKDILAQRGIAPPTSDWTPQAFLQIIAVATTQNGDQSVYGFVSEDSSLPAFLCDAGG